MDQFEEAQSGEYVQKPRLLNQKKPVQMTELKNVKREFVNSQQEQSEFQVNIYQYQTKNLSSKLKYAAQKKKIIRIIVIACICVITLGVVLTSSNGESQKSYEAEESPYIKSKIQGKVVPNFQCKANYFYNWVVSNQNIYVTKGRYTVQKVPYIPLVLVRKSSTPSPTAHFPEIVAYLKQRTVNQPIYIHQAPIYLILLIAASTPQNVSIIISHSFAEKYLVKTCFVFNNIRQKLVFQQAKDEASNIEKSGILVTQSSDFAAKHPKKTHILYVQQSSKNPTQRLTFKLEPVSFCLSPKITLDQRALLDKGLYLLKTSTQLPKQNTDINNKVKAQTQVSPYIKSKIQGKVVPNFQCKANYFYNWVVSNQNIYVTKGRYTVQKVPYIPLVLVRKSSTPSPTAHFPEIVAYLKQRTVNQPIYIHQAPIYLILLIAASTPQNVSIIISHSFAEKYLVKTCFVFNNIRQKLVFQQAKDEASNIEKSGILVTQSSDFAAKHPKKTHILYVQQSSKNPTQRLTFKLEPVSFCLSPKITLDQRALLDKGLYLLKTSTQLPKQNTDINNKVKAQTQVSPYIKSKIQGKVVPNFQCKANYFYNWVVSNQNIYVTKGRYTVQKVPYIPLVLVRKSSTPSPTAHFPEIVAYLKQRTVNQPIYIHQAPIYLILLIAASTPQNVSIIISHSFAEKYLVKTCFVFNNIRQKLVFQQAKDEASNIEKSGILVTQSSDFAAKHPKKTHILYVQQSSKNPTQRLTFKLEPVSFCLSPKITLDQRALLDKGLYLLKTSTQLPKQNTDINNKVKAQTQVSPYIKSKIQGKVVPNFQCKANYFYNWVVSNQNIYVTKGRYTVQKVPYIPLVLVRKSSTPSPTAHFPEIVAYLKQRTVNQPIYIHQAPIYLILLIAASTPQNVSIIISHSFAEKYLVKTCFVFNNIRQKLVFQQAKDEASNIEKSGILVTQSSDFAAKHPKKTHILYVQQSSKNPTQRLTFKLEPVSFCLSPKITLDQRALLDKGLYLLKTSTQLPKQNTDINNKVKAQTQVSPYIKSKIQGKVVPNFQCKANYFYNWVVSNQNIYVTKGRYTVQKVPYIPLVLVRKSSTPSPTAHFPEIVAYLKQRTVNQPIYIHQAPIYLILLIAASTPQNVSIIISHSFAEKYLVKTCFVFNNIRQKLVFQQAKDEASNIEKSGILVTQSSDFAAKHPKKTHILYVQQSSKNPTQRLTFKLEPVSFCLSPKITLDQRALLDKGLYLLKTSTQLPKQNTDINNKVKAQTQVSPYIKSKIQGKVVPNFQCKANYFYNWVVSNQNIYVTKGRYTVQKVPYIPLVLVRKSSTPSPTAHFPEIVAYLKQRTVNQPIYIHQAPIYLILLIAASTPQNVSIIISHSFAEKYLVKTCFVFNNIRQKLVFQQAKDEASNIEKSGILVTQSSDFAAKHPKKTHILYVQQSSINPTLRSTFKLEPVSFCLSPKITLDQRVILDKGVYVILKSR